MYRMIETFTCNKSLLLNAVYDAAELKRYEMKWTDSRTGEMNLKIGNQICHLLVIPDRLNQNVNLQLIAASDDTSTKESIRDFLKEIDGLVRGGVS